MNQQTLNSITLAAIYTPFFSIYIQDFFLLFKIILLFKIQDGYLHFFIFVLSFIEVLYFLCA